jgi:branched-chain amino acid transport system permease protein
MDALIVGIMMGGVYALAAIGFVIIYSTSKVLNFAYGEMIMLGAYLTFLFSDQIGGIPLPIAILLAIIVMTALSFVIERIVLRQLIGRSTIFNTIMVTIGLSLIIRGMVRIIWTSENRVMTPVAPLSPINLGPFSITPIYLFGLTLLAIILIGLSIFLKKAIAGVAMRAVANDEIGAYSIGINIPRMLVLGWGLAGLTAAFTGIVQANLGLLSIGLKDILLVVFAAVVFGGLESIKGAVVGGMVIGLVSSFSASYLDAITGWPISFIMPMIVLSIVILLRPYGLWGVEVIERL